MAVKHSTSSDGTFSAGGATAWDANHTIENGTITNAHLATPDTLRCNGVCNGRLTLESGVAVSSTDQIAKGTLYFTPYNGNQIGTYSGTAWSVSTFAEKSLALAVTSGKNYDVFIVDSTLALELSAAWTNDTTRADALALQDGVYVKSGATTRRWLGTIRASGANTTEDSAGGTTTQVGGKRFVWNRYNQVERDLLVIDTTDSWSYTTDAVRQANGAAGNKVEYVTGDAASLIEATVHGVVYILSNARAAKVGAGVDSTTVLSGLRQGGFNTAASGVYAPITGHYIGRPGLGYHAINWLEKGADVNCVFLGDNAGDDQQTGMYVKVMV